MSLKDELAKARKAAKKFSKGDQAYVSCLEHTDPRFSSNRTMQETDYITVRKVKESSVECEDGFTWDPRDLRLNHERVTAKVTINPL